jgi:hypothetical protein
MENPRRPGGQQVNPLVTNEPDGKTQATEIILS